jgi:hypothetical protein
MRSPIRTAVPLALAAGIVAVAPAAAQKPAPSAHAAGGDVVATTYPSIVNTRVGRTNRALRRAVKQIEAGTPAGAAASVATLKTVRRQMAAAWRGAKYVIRTTPPPVADDARVKAHKSQDNLVLGATPASAADTGVRVLLLQHHVAATMIELIDGAHGTGLNALSTTLNFTLDRRDQALRDIVALVPPAPPATDARVHAHASGTAPVTTTFDTQMPLYAPFLTDEQQAIDGTKSDATDLTNGGRRLLTDAESQIIRTAGFVNTTWPPIPVDA